MVARSIELQHHHILPFLEASNITQHSDELVDIFASGVMGGEAPLEVGIANACRVGTSHSLLNVLIVSIVPMLEEAELDGALDLLLLPSFMLQPDSISRRLRLGL